MQIKLKSLYKFKITVESAFNLALIDSGLTELRPWTQQERVLRGWAHSDKNGNFKKLSAYVQLVSLMKTPLGIIIGS